MVAENKNNLYKNNLSRVLATDCGSTTTKAVLFEKTANGWRQTSRGEAVGVSLPASERAVSCGHPAGDL